MEVFSTNFEETLPQVLADIEKAAFFAFDGEFTGLHDGTIGLFDTPEERYEILRTCVNYNLVQFGLVAFFKEADGYSHRAYNFSVFGGYQRRFVCNTESLSMVSESGFSWDQMIKNGIPYLNLQEEEKLRSKVEEWKKIKMAELAQKDDSKTIVSAIPIDLSAFMDDVFIKVDKFIDSPEQELTIADTTGFQRKLMFEHLRDRYTDLALASKCVNGSRVMTVTKKSAQSQIEELNVAESEKLKEIDIKIGFSKVIRTLSESKKLVIGHNLGLDFIHTLHQFIASVPFEYNEFKKMLSDTFPRFVDTKVMASANPLSGMIPESVLPSIFALVKNNDLPLPKLIDPEPGKGYKMSDSQLHNAGFDAFITGVIFMSMVDRLANIIGQKALSILQERGYAELPIVEAYQNKIHVMKSTDVKYLNIGGPELELDRSHLFHLTFPRHWKTPNIVNLFKPLGYVDIQWIDDTSALVGVNDKSKKDEVIGTVRSRPSSDVVKIVAYHEYKNGFRRHSSPAHRGFKRRAVEAVEESKRTKKDDDEERPEIEVKPLDPVESASETPKPALPETFETPDW